MSRSPVKVWAAMGQTWDEFGNRVGAIWPKRFGRNSAAVGLASVFGDLLHEVDDAATQLRILNPHESLGQ